MTDAGIKSTFFSEWVALTQRLNVDEAIAKQVGEELYARYAEKKRHHHTAKHIVELLGQMAAVQFSDTDAALLAIFFHDSVYALVSGRHSALDEIDSALFAQQQMAQMGIALHTIDKVTQYILATISHKDTGKEDINKFIDLDISVMAASPDRYAIYAHDIKAEYMHIWPLEKYLDGRNKFLLDFATRDRLFLTEAFRMKYEAIALRNILREIADNQAQLKQLQQKVGVYCGSFDPPTRGHMGIIVQAIVRLDVLVIGIGKNPLKEGKNMFTAHERMNLVKCAIEDFTREVTASKNTALVEREAAERIKDGRCKIVVEAYEGLTVDFAIKHNATQLIRGLRPVGNDFAEEVLVANANQGLAYSRNSIATTTFIPTPDEKYAFTSSGHIRLLANEPAVINKFIYPSTAEMVRVRVAQRSKVQTEQKKQLTLIGLTGSIGAGKSYIGRMLHSSHNATIYDTDKIAMQLLVNDMDVIAAIAHTFPAAVVNAVIDVPGLKAEIYGDNKKMDLFEHIIGARVKKQIDFIIKQEKTSGRDGIVVFEAPLLFEKNLAPKFDYTIAVVTAPKTQMEKVIERGKMSLQQLSTILSRQMPQETKMMKADYTIVNGAQTDVEVQLNAAMADILQRIECRSL